MNDRLQSLRERAAKVLVGGVNSPVRAFRAVGCPPLIVEKGEGARLTDANGREYLDFVCSWGALILGHAHPTVVSAVQEQAQYGTSYGITSPLEVELAEEIARALPSMERIRFVSSGTEATMSAIRLARGFTRRDLIAKFEGCYHGHSDCFLSEAGSGLATLGIASSAGVPEAFARMTLNLPYNNLPAVARTFEEHRDQIAAIIVEPVAANMGVVPPEAGFLEGLRELAVQEGALLIFDEVITGFRMAYGGAQTLNGVQPDLTTLGKIIGGGLPVAAYGGRKEIMEMAAPLGPVYQAGTLSGNPLAMRAGIAALREIRKPGFHENLNQKAAHLAGGLRKVLEAKKFPGRVNCAGSLLTIFFSSEPVRNYSEAKKADTRMFASFFAKMLDRGILLPPSQFEALFVSAAHTGQDVDRMLKACAESLEEINVSGNAN